MRAMSSPGPLRRAWRTFSAIKSVVVGALILWLWVRSYFVGDAFRKGSDTQYIELSSGNGAMIIRFGHDGQPTHFTGTWDHVKSAQPDDILIEAGMTGPTA